MKVLTPAFAQKFLAAALVACVAPLAHATAFNLVNISAAGGTGELSQSGGNYSGGPSNIFTSEAYGFNLIFPAGSVGGATCPSPATCVTTQFGANDLGFHNLPSNTSTSLGSTTGAFLALDSDFNTLNPGSSTDYTGRPVDATVDGLVIGQSYIISFNAADAQQNNSSGDSQDQVQVCLNSVAHPHNCQTTPNVTDISEQATPWVANSFTFTADSTSETLTLLGIGGTSPILGQSNVPAFALVDDLSITQTPEPSSLLLMGTGLAGLGGLLRSRFAKKA